jgi:hypothetical protein
MAPIWKPKETELLKSWLDAIMNEASDDLNSWELKFITDMEVAIINRWSITQAQEEKLEQIYTKYTK